MAKKYRFKRVYIEIGNICNKSCVFCPKTKRKLEQMRGEDFKMVIDKVKDYTSNIYLHIMGEPLLHKELAQLLDIVSDTQLKVNITTNGSLIRDNLELLQHESIRKISISVHSFEANAIDNTLKEYLDDIVYFTNSLSDDKIIELRLWNEGENSYSKLNDDIIQYIYDALGYEGERLHQNTKVRDNVYLMFAKVFGWPDERGEYYGDIGYCHGLLDQIGVLVNGDVVPCCLDNNGTIRLGNIFSSTLAEILDTPRAKNIIDGFKNRKRVENLCKHCEYSTRFDK